MKTEKTIIGKVLLGESKREADLISVVQKEPYRHYFEANGEEFDGHRALWSFSYQPYNYLKESELSGDEYRKGGSIKIFRDGVCMRKEFCREPLNAASRMWHLLAECIDGMCEYAVVGRKIYHAGVPSIVDSICDDGEIIVRTEDGKDYRIYGHTQEDEKNGDFDNEWKDKDRIHYTDKRISWFRSDSPQGRE